MKLKFEEVKTLHAEDIKDICFRVYGFCTEFLISEQHCFYSCKFVTVEKREFSSFELVRWEKFLNKERPFYILALVLSDLCNRDILDEGKYLVLFL